MLRHLFNMLNPLLLSVRFAKKALDHFFASVFFRYHLPYRR